MMKCYSICKLGDIIEQIRGVSYKLEDLHSSLDSESITLLRANNIQEGQLSFEDVVYVDCKRVKGAQRLKKGDILICTSSGSKDLVGKAAVVKEDVNATFGAFCKVVRVKKECPQYIACFFDSPTYRKKISHASAGANINNIRGEHIDGLNIPIPPLDEQRHIAAVLDKVSDLIAQRKQQLTKLDELVKARFVEMFGDPVLNSLGWNQELLSNVTSKIGSGATPKGGRESYKEDGISLIRSMNVHDGRFDYKDLAHITDQQAKQLDGVTVEKGDVFINITGASVARSCIVPTDVLPARVNQHVSIIRCKSDRLNPIFANNLFLNNRFKDVLLSIGESGGATRQAITKQQLEALTVIVPPLSLQVDYADFVGQINQSKVAVQQGLDKLETLKSALMQEYFG